MNSPINSSMKKKTALRSPLLVCLFVFVSIGDTYAKTPETSAKSATQLLNAVMDNMRTEAVQATLELTVTRPSSKTLYKLKVVSDGDKKSYSRVYAPAREAGTAFLRLGNNIQVYNPLLKRVLRLPPSGRSDNFLGSDLSYSDMFGRDFEKDYTSRLVPSEAKVLKFELLPKPQAPTPYGRLVFVARKNDLAPLQIVFYDQRKKAVKRITFKDHVQIKKWQFPTVITVNNLLRKDYRTTLKYSKYKLGGSLPKACFRTRALEAGC